jgi:DNA-binding transcriptional LysR family regulator
MLDRFTGMQVFASVAAQGSLSAAARALGMSQTMATKHIAALEVRLGVKLLHRTTRRLTLTEAGRAYLDAVERILGEVDDADAEAAAGAVEVRGTLRLNAPFSFGIREVAPLIPGFLRNHPALTIDLGLNDRQVDLIEEGWDLAVRIGDMVDSSLIARRLAPCHTVICAAPRYLTGKATPRTIADLAHHNCLGYTLSQFTGVGRWLFGSDRKTSVTVSGSLKANNGDALVAAAVAGEGIVYQPTFLVAREIAAGLLVPIELDQPGITLDGIFAIYPASRRPPAKVRAFIDFLAKHFGPVPEWDRICQSAVSPDRLSPA